MDADLHVTPAQIRGGRAMLRWSMIALAREAGVSVSTIKRFENELPQGVAPHTVMLMCGALTRGGVDFLRDGGAGEGLRLRLRGGAT